MATMNLSDRERYAIYLVVNTMNHPDRASRKRWDRVWDKLKLDDIARTAPNQNMFIPQNFSDESPIPPFEISSEERDMLISSVCGAAGLSTAVGRLLNRAEAEMVKARDGEANQDK